MRFPIQTLAATIAVAMTVWPLHAGEAATVGGTVITEAELERAAATRLLRVRTEAYEARREAIENRIGELLLVQRAAKEQLPPAQWLEREIAKRPSAVTPAEVEAAYETLSGDVASKDKEQALADLARGMREARRQQLEQDVLRDLRMAAKVELRLQPPRLDRHDLGGAPVHGPDDAPVTMVVFQDFQCPRCATLVQLFPVLRERYPTELRILHRDFPLANHPRAKAAAEAAACASEQGKFWEMAEALYANQDSLTRASFEEAAVNAGVDRAELTACLDSGRQTRSWKEGLAAARELTLRGTPTIFINGRLIAGARDFETYTAIIDEELARQ